METQECAGIPHEGGQSVNGHRARIAREECGFAFRGRLQNSLLDLSSLGDTFDDDIDTRGNFLNALENRQSLMRLPSVVVAQFSSPES